MRTSAWLLKMAGRCLSSLLKPISSVSIKLWQSQERFIHISPALFTVRAGKVKITPKRNKPVTYEDSYSPPHIAHRKSWNSWNTSTIEGGLRPGETAVDDLFIRKFLQGTFPDYIVSKIIIKRQHNIIRAAFMINTLGTTRRLCFLIGYAEELLSHWLHCIVKLEIQVINDTNKLIFKYV